MCRRLTAFLTVALLGPAAPALAEDFHAASPGSGSACTQPDPCPLQTALNNADSADDTVILAAGTYTPLSAVVVDVGVTVRPADGADVTIARADEVVRVLATAVGARLSDLTITQEPGGTGPALETASPDLVADRLVVTGADAIQLTSGTPVVSNTVARATAADGTAVRAGTAEGAALVHVTALAPGASATGVLLQGVDPRLLVRNSIVLAGGTDTQVVAGALTVEYTNVRGVTGTGTQDADPQLDADGRPAATSPVIDAGQADGRAGSLDLAGATRVSRCAPDLGAFELQATCPPGPDPNPNPNPTPTPDPDPTPQQPGPQQPPPVIQQPGPITFPGLLAGDFVDPTIRNLRARADRRRRVSVTLRTSEPVLVRFVVERRINGRRLRGRCVTGRRKGARCTRYVVVRRVRRQLRAGSVKANLGSLRSGVYRVTARAQDAARNQSVRKRATVRVRARR